MCSNALRLFELHGGCYCALRMFFATRIPLQRGGECAARSERRELKAVTRRRQLLAGSGSSRPRQIAVIRRMADPRPIGLDAPP